MTLLGDLTPPAGRTFTPPVKRELGIPHDEFFVALSCGAAAALNRGSERLLT
jgi:hypothetical protein